MTVPAAPEPPPWLARIPTRPGVYRLLDAAGQVLYVGKARDLRRRVGSYFSGRLRERRLQALVAQVADVGVTVTATESAALLLENELIKSLQPRYNVLLRDDKSYPGIRLTGQNPFPRLAIHRGAARGGDRVFGPYPSASAVRETLRTLQKLFRLRSCEDAVFRHRSRPCLEYQIQRCSGPCVGRITPREYAEDMGHAIDFLEGRAEAVCGALAQRMEEAAAALEFERAAQLRDRIALLHRLQAAGGGTGGSENLDVIACASAAGVTCVQVFFFRAGRSLGHQAWFPQVPPDTAPGALMAAFLTQFYATREIPAEILLAPAPEPRALLERALSGQAGHRVVLRQRGQGERARWLDMARDNARSALEARLGGQAEYHRRLEALRAALARPDPLTRLECFDVSHTQGERPVASCVVFDETGPCRAQYRRFSLDEAPPGDDCAALYQALRRRYLRIRKGEFPPPDLLLVDGGRGQLAQAEAVLRELALPGIAAVGIAKGPARRPGDERLWLSGRRRVVILAAVSPALHLVQQIRDEAHRFALAAHRQRRARARTTSVLETIDGIGPKRRQRLLRQFGGLSGLRRAEVEEIAQVAGIGRGLAEEIYRHLHAQGD